MFNTENIGRQISKRRKELNMTQLELADKLLVSYQAVSQWETGKSMPDLENLIELKNILGVSFDELLEEDETEVVEKLIEEETLEEEDLIKVAPLLKPDRMKKEVRQLEIGLTSLVALAPFLEEEELDEMVKSMDLSEGSYVNLCALAPFLNEETLSDLVKKGGSASNLSLVALAPFLSEDALEETLLGFEEVKSLDLAALAPFLSSKALYRILKKNGVREAPAALMPFMKEKHRKKLREE